MLWALFRKVHVNNRHGVPIDKPVLLAANHPTAAIEPYLLTVFLDPPIYNMTRGDIFRRPFFRKFMEQINMFPVFRKRDGYQEKDRNDGVFEFCIEKLRQNRIVTIYVEGEHHLEKRVRPSQKGIARIAFAAYEKHRNDELQIIPAGCNYAFGDRWRDEAFMNIGEPLLIRDYWPDYQRDPGGTMLRLCRDIETALKKVCYHLDKEEDDELADQLLTLYRSNNPQSIWPFTSYDDQRFLEEKAILNRLNTMPTGQKSSLREQSAKYFNALKKAGLTDDALQNPGWGSLAWLLFLLPGALPALAGYIAGRPVGWPSTWVANNKIRKREFYTSVIVSIGLIGGLIYVPLTLLIALLSWKATWISAALLMPLLAWFFLIYRDILLRWWAARRATAHPERRHLLQLRQGISY